MDTVNVTISDPSNSNMPQPNQTFRIVRSSDGTDAAVIKNSAGGIAYVEGSNVAAAARYLKLYNQSTLPNVGTDVPFYTKYLPAQSDFTMSFGGSPLVFTNGIAIAFTALQADNDSTPIQDGDVMGTNVAFY